MAKRPAEDGAPDSNPAPSKKLRPAIAEPETVYVVTVTHFADDYRARRHNWSESQTLGLFRSRRRANQRADKEILSLVRDRLIDREEDSDFAEYWEHSSDDEPAGASDEEPTLNMKRVRRDLYELEARLAEGDFVPRKFSVDIEEALLDERSA